MSAGVDFQRPSPAEEAIDGERRAERIAHAAASAFVGPDRLLHELLDVLDADGRAIAPTPRLRGFCRVLQKRLEERGGAR